MAYIIRYGGRSDLKVKTGRSKLWLYTGVFLGLFILAVNLFWKDGAEVLGNILMPMQAHTKEAADTMIQSIQTGTTVTDAVTAFCQEIIDHAALP